MASESSSKRPSTKKLARTLKVTAGGRDAGGATESSRPSDQNSASKIEQEHNLLTLAEVWDEEDAAFFQPYADRIMGKAP